MIGYDEVRKTYFVQVKYRDPITLKQRTKKKRGFKTKREAKIYEAEAMQQGNDPSDLTFEQVAHQWEEYALPSKEQARRHQVAFERRFAGLYKRPIKSITRAQLVAWRAELANSDQCGTKIKNDTISFVKGVFRYYSTVYNVVDNSVILKRLKKTDKEIMQEMKK